MPLPTITPYTLPKIKQVPASRAPWLPDASRAVLLLHDLQDYFLRPFVEQAPPLSEMLDNLRRICRQSRALDVPIVFSAQPGEQDRAERGLLWDLWGPGIVLAPELSGIRHEFAPQDGDLVIHKRRYSAFFNTELQAFLHSQNRSQIWITGVYGHIGCLATATDGFMRGVEPIVIADAIADFSFDEHLMALSIVARTCGVVTSTDELLRSMNDASPYRPIAAGTP